MAAKLVSVIQRYTGTKTEKDALVLTSVQIGSTYLQTDAAAGHPKGIYTLSSAGAWVHKEETVNSKVADGDDVTLGAKADAAATVADATPFSAIALLKGLWNKLAGTLDVTLTGSITPTHSVATVGVATGVVLAANPNRKYALIINDSDSYIYLKIGVDAVLNEGIRLNPNGGSYELCAANGNLATGAINGIASAAAKNICVTEGV